MSSPRRLTVVAYVTAAAAAAIGPASSTGALVDDMLGRPELAWTLDDELNCDDGSCELIVYDGAAYVLEVTPPDAGRVIAVDAEGELLWSTDVAGVGNMSLFDDLVYLEGADRVVTIERTSGAITAEVAGTFVDATVFETFFVIAPDGSPMGIDGRTGDVLWTQPPSRDIAATCYATVILAERDTVAALTIVDHRSGTERATTDHVFAADRDIARCRGIDLFVAAEGELSSYWASDGWLDWSIVLTAAPTEVELFSDVALITDSATGSTKAFDRRDGLLLWEVPTSSLGVVVSSSDRVRADRSGYFLLDTDSGEAVARADGNGRHVGFTGNRMVVIDDAVITAYGVADLGAAWSVELDDPIDDLDVDGDLLVTRSGGELRGYR